MTYWLDQAQQLAAAAIAFPLLGMVIMLGGWSVGQICMNPQASGWSKYLHTCGLGVAAYLLIRQLGSACGS
jgi:hypothetical protein